MEIETHKKEKELKIRGERERDRERRTQFDINKLGLYSRPNGQWIGDRTDNTSNVMQANKKTQRKTQRKRKKGTPL